MATARRKAAQAGKAKPPAKKAAAKKPRRRSSVGTEPEAKKARKVAGSTPGPAATRKKAPPKKPATASRPAKTTADLITGKAAPEPDRPLTPQHEAFITEYLRNGRNGTAAYLSAYPNSSPAAAAVSSWHLLRNPKLAGRIQAEVDRLVQQHVMSRDDLMADLVAIVRADPAELMQMRHVSCDECWPKTDGPMGNWTEPNPECLHCAGQGILKPWMADTRKLTPGAKALFAGIKVTKDGVQVLTESKADARDKLARILGAYEKDNEQKNVAAEALREFFGHLHAGAGRLAVVRKASAGAPPGSTNPLVKG